MASKYLLEGRKAIVTGGASGIGEAIVQAFFKEGAEVLVVDIPESKISNSYNENPNIYISGITNHQIESIRWEITKI